ncbi:MAG: hypothetical protein ACRC6T_02415 [Sarcina sp.]
MTVVPIMAFLSFKNIFKENKRHLKENFSTTILIKSIFEILIFLITFIYFCILIMISRLYLLPASLLLLNSILLVATKFIELTYKADDVGNKFFSAINNTGDINQNITISWRLKHWSTPHFDIKNLRKNNNVLFKFSSNQLLPLLVIFIFAFGANKILGLLVLLLSILIISIIANIDKPFNSYVKFEGFCLKATRIYDRSNNITACTYRIIDFHNQREFNLYVKTDKVLRYKNGDKVIIIHGALSKKVMDHYSAPK